jgi:hypothetical protein
MIGAMCVLLAAIAYVGHWFDGRKPDSYATVPVGSAQESAAVASTARPPAASSKAANSPAATTAVAMQTGQTPATILPGADNLSSAPPSTAAAKADAAKRATARLRQEKAPVALPPPEPSPPQVIIVAQPPPPPAVVEAPRPDRWQLMTEAIARCPRADFSNRYSCEQRLRAQYCEGHWGQVPQCASIPYTDHGQ